MIKQGFPERGLLKSVMIEQGVSLRIPVSNPENVQT
jgi:hypothetical protein